MKKLVKIALQYDILILLVAHRRKSQGTTDINDEISGSGDITNLAGIVTSYDRNENTEVPGDRLLKLTKSRLIGKLNFDGIPLNYDEKTKRIYGFNDDLYKTFSWTEKKEFESVDFKEVPFYDNQETIFN